MENATPARRPLTVEDYTRGVLAGDRSILARAITLIESKSALHEAQAQELVQRLLPHSGKARRVGITGVPGVGKSTFIEYFGCWLIERGQKIAILTVDPTSARSRGSILGDKTRMEKLSQKPEAFIRPSPSGETLGGVTRRTRESMVLCDAAGFDLIIVESVGVGQSEITLRSMVDFFLLLLLPGAGDDLQGIKKGIVEMADAVFINKADGDNQLPAQRARLEQESSIHHLQPFTPAWKVAVGLCSAVTGEGISEIWELIEKFYAELQPKGVIERLRRQQLLDWLTDLTFDELRRRFQRDERVKASLPRYQQMLLRGEMTAFNAAKALLDLHAQPISETNLNRGSNDSKN